jgi:hypothetical protein
MDYYNHDDTENVQKIAAETALGMLSQSILARREAV